MSANTKPERRWWRRAKRILIGLAVLAVVLRIALVFALPSILNAVAGKYGLQCRYERLDLSLLTGDLELWHLAVAPDDGGEPYLHQEYLRADLSMASLLLGKVVVRRLEVDGLDLNIERGADGELVLLKRMREASPPTDEADQPERETRASEQLDLSSPVRIDAVRLQHVHARFRDASVTPAFETKVELDVRLSDVGVKERAARFELQITAPPVLEILSVEGEGSSDVRDLVASLEVAASGIHLEPIRAYLAPLGVQPVARELSAHSLLHVTARPAGKDPRAVCLSAALEQTTLRADREEAFAIDRVAVEADSLGLDGASLRASIAGVRGRCVRLASQALRVAGVDLVPVVAPSAASPSLTTGTPLAESQAPAKPYPITLSELRVSEVEGAFVDQAIEPAAALEAKLLDLTVGRMVLGQSGPVTIDARATIPGVIEAAHLSGTATPFAERKDVALDIALNGIAPVALEPYLRQAQVESQLQHGSFRCRVQASVNANDDQVAANATLSEVVFRDGETELFALPLVKIADVRVLNRQNAIEIGEVTVIGPVLPLARAGDGRLAAVGLRLGGGAPREASAPKSAKTTSVTSTPRISLAKLRWRDAKIDVRDDAVSPPANLALGDLGLEIDQLVLQPDVLQEPSRGALRLSFAMPGIAQKVEIDGTIVPSMRAPEIDLHLAARGVTAAALAPQLAELGIESLLHDGALELKLVGKLELADAALGASVALRDMRFTDRERELWGVDAVVVDKLELAPGGVKVHSIAVEHPRVVLERDASGVAIVSQLRLTGAPPSSAPPAALASPVASAGPPPPGIEVGGLKIKNAQVDWSDASVSPAVKTQVSLALDVGPIAIGREVPPTPITMSVHANDWLDELSVSGSLELALATQGATLDLRARGLRAGVLEPYLPSGTRLELQNGSLQAKLLARAKPNPEGGRAMELAIDGVDYRDGASATALLTIDAIHANVTRLDPEHVIAIDEVAVRGVEATVVRTAAGVTHALGFAVTPPAPNTEATAIASATPPLTPPADAPPFAQAAPAPASPLPQITWQKLDLELRRLTVIDENAQQPLTLAARLVNKAPLDLLGDDPETDPPVDLELRLQAAPLVDSLVLAAHAVPFASQPLVEAVLDVTGIHADRIADVLPALQERLDGSQLNDGRLHAELSAGLRMSRRNALDFDVQKGFGLDVECKNVALQNGANGPVLLGVEDLHADVKRIDLASGSVYVNVIEIMKPIAVVRQQADGLNVAGVLLKSPPAPVAAAAGEPVAVQDEPARQSAPAQPLSEIRIDRFLVSGIDVRYEDSTCDPMLEVPLTGLEVDVRQITTLALRENRTIPFSVLMRGGPVTLQKALAGGLLGGMLSDALSVVKGKGVQRETEQRDLFEEIGVKGRLALYPRPAGSVKTSITGLELAAFKGLAAKSSVTLDSGVMDGVVTVDLVDGGGLQADTRIVFGDLSLSEPPDGPIFRYLHLPAPLNTVLFVLRDQNEAIKLPLSVAVGADGVTASQITQVAITTLGQLIARALASAPMRAANTVTGTLGSLVPFSFGGEAEKLEPGVVTCRPGETRVTASDLVPLQKIIDRLRDDEQTSVTLQHTLGGGDLPLVSERANPSRADGLRFLTRLRAERSEVEHARDDLAAQARAALASGLDQDAELLSLRLRGVEQRLGSIDRSLERVYELLSPGAQRNAARRTRDAALDLARLRLAALRAALIEAVPGAGARIRANEPRFEAATDDRGGTITVTAGRTQEP